MYPSLTADTACAALATIGLQLLPEQVAVEKREERWLVRMPDNRLAWFAASQEGKRRLVRERRVLRVLEARCSFAVPRILMQAATGEFDVRTMVPGMAEPWTVVERVQLRPDLARDIGAQLGAILAEQHTRIDATDLAGHLPSRPDWPESPEWIQARLPEVVSNRNLVAQAGTVMSMYEAVPVSDTDRALVHGDVGFHNLAIDLATFTVTGIFDYDGAAWADRHHDFRYLLLDFDRSDLLEACLAVYEPAIGQSISRDRVTLYNAACAITFLANRAGIRPEVRWCGRTLAEDLLWSRTAIKRALAVRL